MLQVEKNRQKQAELAGSRPMRQRINEYLEIAPRIPEEDFRSPSKKLVNQAKPSGLRASQ